MRYESLQMLENRALFAEEGSGDSLILPLPMKTLGTELQQDMGDLAYDMLGADSTVLFSADFEPTVGDNEPNYRATAPNTPMPCCSIALQRFSAARRKCKRALCRNSYWGFKRHPFRY